MAVKFLDNTGLGYFWSKIKAWCNATFAAIAHTHTSYAVKHSYTTAANAAKNWYRIANANTQQLDISKPIRAQFIVTAYNTSYAADYYETWFVNAIVFGRQAHIVIFGGSGVPFSQARILYEYTVANIDANDRPAIDLYLNYVLPNGTTKIEVEEIYNSGWTFLADGQLVASTAPSGFESIATAPRYNGVNNSTYADYVSYLNRQISNFTAAFTLADSYLYRSRTLNCTGTFTITIPSINSGYMWCVIKNKNTSSGVITLHPSTTSVLIDGSNADIMLQPMEYVCIHSAGANNYSLIADGRWKSQKADKATTLAGYGITDAKIANGTITLGSNSITPLTSHQTLPTLSRTISGSGNAITDITVSNHAITATKGTTFLTSHQTLPTLSKTDSGSGNAVTAISVSNHAITVTKGSTFLTSADAKISNGTITIGSNSITPLTSDSNFVHKTGTELIEGIKKFKENYSRVLHTVMQRNVTPASDLYGGYYYLDKDENGLGVMEFSQRSDGGYDFKLCCYDQAQSATAGENIIGPYLYVGRDANGIEYVNCTQTSDQRGADGDVLTRNWIPKDERIVHSNGDEMSGALKINVAYNGLPTKPLLKLSAPKPYYAIQISATDLTKGTAPSSDIESSISFYGNQVSTYKDRVGIIKHNTSTSKTSSLYLTAIGEASNQDYTGCTISCNVDANGNAYTSAPTPATADNSTKIATTAFVKAQGYLTSHQSLSNYVTLNSNQTITGYKIFNNTQIGLVTDQSSLELLMRFSNAEIGIASPSSNRAGFTGILDKNNNYISYIKYGLGNISTYMQFSIVNPRTDGGSKTITLCSSNTAWDYWWFGPLSNATNSINLGQSGAVWKQLYAGTTTISTSDKRLKDNIENVSNDILDAWEDVDFVQFKFKDAIQEKGEKARIHHGMIAQDIRDIFNKHDVDVTKYSFFCWDSWESKPAVYKDGKIEQPATEAGDSYALRYEELLCIEAAYQRRKNKILENRISELEKQVSDMLILLQNLTNGNG